MGTTLGEIENLTTCDVRPVVVCEVLSYKRFRIKDLSSDVLYFYYLMVGITSAG